MSRALPWIALAIGLSPAGFELLRHVRAEPWAAYVSVFAVLVLCWLVAGPGAPARRAGILLVLAAGILEILAAAGGMERFGRPAIPLAIIGMSLALGRLPLRRAALSLWIVPVPNLLLVATTPQLQRLWLEVAGGALRALGAPLEIDGMEVRAASGVLRLTSSDGGLPLVALLSGLGWYASLRRDDPPGRGAATALVWGLWGFPAQLVVVGLALLVLALGGSGATAWVLNGAWIPVALLGLWWERRRRHSA